MTRPRTPHAELVAVVAGVLLGALTALGQQYLPDAVRSLANASAPWCVAGFALAWRAGTTRRAALTGALCLAALLVGYVVASSVRGHASSSSLLLFWGAAAVVVGPVLGVAASWARRGAPVRAAVGAAVPAGVLVGEAAYGRTVVADTTPGGYWLAQGVAGVVLLLVLGLRGRWGVREAVVATAVTATVAGLFLVAYSSVSL